MLTPFSGTRLLAAFGLAFLVAGAAWRLGALDRSGFLAAGLLGGFIYGLGGLSWAVLLVAFFASSSALSRLFSSSKDELAAHFAKGGQRDWAQVAANGGVPALFLLAALVGLPTGAAWVGYAAALATVTADTWGTELGVLSRAQPRLITSGRRVERGTSGGISTLGTGASLQGGVFIGFLAGWLNPEMGIGTPVMVVALTGLLGSLLDSWMGATAQAIYYCPVCAKETERHPRHVCGAETELARGWSWLNNDWVNFLSALVAALLAVALAVGLRLVG